MNSTLGNQPSSSGDRRVEGFLFALVLQVLLFLIGVAVIDLAHERGLVDWLLVTWGVPQWIVIIPLARYWRSHGKPKAAQALLIQGFIGLLLSSACAALFYVAADIKH